MVDENARHFLFGFTIDNLDDCGTVHHVEMGETIRGTFDKAQGMTIHLAFPLSVTFEVRENNKSIFKIEVIKQKTYEEYYAMCVRAWTKFKEENPQAVNGLLEASKVNQATKPQS